MVVGWSIVFSVVTDVSISKSILIIDKAPAPLKKIGYFSRTKKLVTVHWFMVCVLLMIVGPGQIFMNLEKLSNSALPENFFHNKASPCSHDLILRKKLLIRN